MTKKENCLLCLIPLMKEGFGVASSRFCVGVAAVSESLGREADQIGAHPPLTANSPLSGIKRPGFRFGPGLKSLTRCVPCSITAVSMSKMRVPVPVHRLTRMVIINKIVANSSGCLLHARQCSTHFM